MIIYISVLFSFIVTYFIQFFLKKNNIITYKKSNNKIIDRFNILKIPLLVSAIVSIIFSYNVKNEPLQIEQKVFMSLPNF